MGGAVLEHLHIVAETSAVSLALRRAGLGHNPLGRPSVVDAVWLSIYLSGRLENRLLSLLLPIAAGAASGWIQASLLELPAMGFVVIGVLLLFPLNPVASARCARAGPSGRG